MVKMKTDPAQILVNILLEAEENVDWSPDPETEPIRDVTRLETELDKLGFKRNEKTGQMVLNTGRIHNNPKRPRHKFVVWLDKQSWHYLTHYRWSRAGRWEHTSTQSRGTEDGFLAMLWRMNLEAYADDIHYEPGILDMPDEPDEPDVEPVPEPDED